MFGAKKGFFFHFPGKKSLRFDAKSSPQKTFLASQVQKNPFFLLTAPVM